MTLKVAVLGRFLVVSDEEGKVVASGSPAEAAATLKVVFRGLVGKKDA